MKTIMKYLAVLAFMTSVLGGQACLSAAEEVFSMMCDEGVVNIGDMDVDVQEKCGEPNSQGINEWVYDFGPSEPVYKVIFDAEGKVVRILEDDQIN
jgi:hypothetical protein